MRKIQIAIGGIALGVLGVSISLYIVNNPLRPPKDSPINFSPLRDEVVVSPADLLRRASHSTPSTSAPVDESTATATVAEQRVIYPDWREGSARVSDSDSVTSSGDFAFPRWSPVGLDIAFTNAKQDVVYLVGPSGGGIRPLVTGPGVGTAYEWNIDGMSMRVHSENDEANDLMITGEKYPAGAKRREVFERDNYIFRQVPDGEPVRVSGSQDRFGYPQVSPDETQVLYIGRETGIYVSALDGSRTINIGKGSNPTWLPDSSGVVYEVSVSDSSGAVDSDLWYARIDGKERTNLTRTPGIAEIQPAVARDGERIAYSRDGSICVGRFVREYSASGPSQF